MTAAARVTGRPGTRPSPVVPALARADAWRLTRHPFVLGGVALGLVMLAGTGGRVNGAFELLQGYGLMPLAIGTSLAGHLLASREHRNRTAELWGTLPTPARRRTLAALVALVGPLVLGVAYLATAVVAVQAWDGVPVALAEGIVALRPAPAELAQGLVAVGFCGALGVALGTWLPSRGVAPILLAGWLFTFTVLGWNAEGWLRWALPATHHEREVLEWVQVTPNWGYSVTDGYDRIAMAWHVAYVAAFTGLLAVVALLRHERARRLVVTAVVLAGLTAVLSVVQIP